jgi:hypothetical protein
MSESAFELWHNQRSVLRNRYRQEYLDYMLRVVERARAERNGFILANALMACAGWMSEAGRLEEALAFYEQRLDPAVWQEDKLEIRCVREFIEQIKRELAARGRGEESKGTGSDVREA